LFGDRLIFFGKSKSMEFPGGFAMYVINWKRLTILILVCALPLFGIPASLGRVAYLPGVDEAIALVHRYRLTQAHSKWCAQFLPDGSSKAILYGADCSKTTPKT